MEAKRSDILVVDDTPANLALLSSMLKEEGYRVRPVPSGALALRAAEREAPDLILLDINMPDMDGYEVCRRLKQHPDLQDIPVLFISALSEANDKLEAFRVGGVDYVTKPFHIEEVRARVRTHLRLRQVQLEVESNYRDLKALEDLRDNLTSMIVHDMRSLLTGLVGSLQLLSMQAMEALSEPNRQDLQRAGRSGARLVSMVNELLDISRLEAGEMPVVRSVMDLEQSIGVAVGLLGALAQDHTIEVDVDSEIGQFECDHSLIQRVFTNLLHNALKFSPAQSTVRVQACPSESGIRITVLDEGPGIAVEHRERIFDKFGQVQARQQKVASSGLGLSFCKLAVEAHGGTIGVVPAPGGGSAFWLELPAT